MLLMIATASPLLGQSAEQSSAQAGYRISQRLCVGCHVIDHDAPNPVPAGIATFCGIADRFGQTGQKIMDALISPQHPMPDMQLSIEEISDIIAYMETLRTDHSAPPLIGPAAPALRRAPPTRS